MALSEEQFERQFASRNTIDFEGGEISYIDVHPETQETELPLLLSSGWAETLVLLKDTIYAFVSHGYRVIVLDYTSISLNSVSVEKEVAYKKGRAIIEVLDELKIDKINVVAHSEGAINTVLAARLKPELFCHLILVAPAGLDAHASLVQLAFGFASETVSSIYDSRYRKRAWQHFRQLLYYMVTNPIQSLKEAFSASHARISCTIKTLIKKGVSVSLICSDDDNMFPVKKIKRMIAKRELNLQLHVVEGGHNELHLHPTEYVTRVSEELSC